MKSDLPKVLIADGGRHRAKSGYGSNARSIIRRLAESRNVSVAVLRTSKDWEIDDETKQRLPHIEYIEAEEVERCDVALHIGNPSSFRYQKIPTGSFCCCDLSDLTGSQLDSIKEGDFALAPNKENLSIFKKYFTYAYLAQQGIDEAQFQIREKYRSEGRDKFSLLFVGTASFRKGFDILIKAFCAEFESEEAHLHLHLPRAQVDRAFDMVMAAMNDNGRIVDITISSDQRSTAWIERMHNRSDAFITCTRGEGWCLPIVEALLCGKPIISPFTGGMKDYLTSEIAFEIPTKFQLVDDIEGDFGRSFKHTYRGYNIGFYEPSLEGTRKSLRLAHQSQDKFKKMGYYGRKRILELFSEKRFGESIESAIISFLRKDLAPKPPNHPTNAGKTNTAPAK